jgi:uncharacterized membrane protein
MKQVQWRVGVTTYEASHRLPILGPSVPHETARTARMKQVFHLYRCSLERNAYKAGIVWGKRNYSGQVWKCAVCLPATSVKQGNLNSVLLVMGVWTRPVTHLIHRLSCDFM